MHSPLPWALGQPFSTRQVIRDAAGEVLGSFYTIIEPEKGNPAFAVHAVNNHANLVAVLKRIDQYLGSGRDVGGELYRHGVMEGDGGPDSITPQILVRLAIEAATFNK